jgi:SAM-dependent methyltransferase
VNGFTLERCERCATLFTADLPSAGQDATDYDSYYSERNLEIPEFVRHRLGQLVDDFEQYRDRNTWLDIGCGAGSLLSAAAERGWEPVGTEVAGGAVDALRSRAMDVRLGELAELGLEPGSFDVVSLVEVIEHVPAPGELIQAAADLVRPGGALYVTTPHGRGISARLLRRRWSALSPPEHLQLFSIKGLGASLARGGLEAVRIRADAVNPRELLEALRRRDDVVGDERVASGYRLNESLSGGRGGRALKAVANAALNGLRLGDALKATAHKPGSGRSLP